MRSKPGFTLVELLVVIGVIALLISILLPALSRARAAAIQTQCLSRHRQWMFALAQYVQENDGWGPPSATQVTDPPNTPPFYAASAYSYWVRWQNRRHLGKYLGNKSEKSDATPSTVQIYCAAYKQDAKLPLSYNSDDIGIGINIRSGCRWFRSQGGVTKFTSIRGSSSDILTFVDVYSGYSWEKYYFNDPGGTATGGNTSGMVEYRHGANTIASFADGHSDVFTRKPTNTTYMNTGLHAAYLANEITHLPTR